MGLYRRAKKRKDGTVRKSRVWWMSYVVNHEQHCCSTGTTNRRLAERVLNKRLAEITEGRFQLPRSSAPQLEQFAKEFLESVRHPNTKKRYATSVTNLQAHFGDIQLSRINAEGIDEFKDARLAEKVRAATVNRDLAVLRRMLKIAERKRLIPNNPFREVEMLEERKEQGIGWCCIDRLSRHRLSGLDTTCTFRASDDWRAGPFWPPRRAWKLSASVFHADLLDARNNSLICVR